MRRTTTTAAAAVVLIPLLVSAAGSPALAATDSGDVAVTNTETVQARLSASGAFQSARVYEQLTLTGSGTATIENPVSTKGLRNLDGFGGQKVVDGKQVSTLTVDGERRERSLSTYDKELPLTVEVTYTFDGETVQPGAVVGKSGVLGVRYKVTNVTGATQDVTYDDGTGTQATASAETVIPMIGQLVTVLPSSFTDVQSAEAGIAGDGRGGTRMQFQMTLFPPIGSETAEFGYTAQVRGAVIPKATLTSMAVSPLSYPSFKGGAASYQAGAQKGVDLTGAGLKLDDSVLQLHDGAAQLLAGLLQLRDGAAKLESGLNDTAAPGAAELAAGLNDRALPGINELAAGLSGKAASGAAQLASGLNTQLVPGAAQLAAGLNNQLAPGAAQLAAGLNGSAAPGAAALALGAAKLDDGLAQASAKAPALIDGLTQVDAGLALVDAGLEQLYDNIGALKDDPGVAALHAGITQLRAGIGSTTTPDTLLAGADQLRQQVGTAAPTALATMALGVYNTDPAAPGAYQKLGCAVSVLGHLRHGAAPGADPCYASSGGIRPPLTATTDPFEQAVLDGLIAQLQAGRADLADPANLGNPTVAAFYGAAPSADPTLQQGLTYLQGRLANIAGPGLTKIECGLSNGSLPGVCDPAKPGLLEGLAQIDGGVTALVSGVTAKVQAGVGDDDDLKADGSLRGGVHSLQAGTAQLSVGGSTLVSGLGQLGTGAQQLRAGAGTLSTGIQGAAAGSTTLSGGLSSAAAGSTKLSDGVSTAAAGSTTLSQGIGTAASGSSKLAAGIASAAAGSERLASGLQDAAAGSTQLSDGLTTAADGAPKLVDGTQRLSDEGTSQVVVNGQSTAKDFGVRYAVLSAEADRAAAEGMAYGAPDGAAGFTAYSIDIAGVDRAGASVIGRLVLAVVLFAAGIGLATLARRRFA
ncbi:hypothetical protein [uncultured Cellulomonas sp.]|uniref:hypothetical protein n=1 Tax=uncultured Cellulomonas sp. TaxID=189682 RepID=UPI0028E8F034|nr:hypothetical protein [uncultured Cellulomonas sp.]